MANDDEDNGNEKGTIVPFPFAGTGGLDAMKLRFAEVSCSPEMLLNFSNYACLDLMDFASRFASMGKAIDGFIAMIPQGNSGAGRAVSRALQSRW